MGLVTSKNFITCNAVENILAGDELPFFSALGMCVCVCVFFLPCSRGIKGRERPDGSFAAAHPCPPLFAVPKKTDVRQVSYMNKKGYGKVPAYLEKVKSEIQDEYNYIMQMQDAAQEEMDDEGYGRTRMLSEPERIEMLNGMKTNWDRINKAYQTLSFTLDTPAKKQRKEEFEAQLEQLERDIERLSKRNVFVEEEREYDGY